MLEGLCKESDLSAAALARENRIMDIRGSFVGNLEIERYSFVHLLCDQGAYVHDMLEEKGKTHGEFCQDKRITRNNLTPECPAIVNTQEVQAFLVSKIFFLENRYRAQLKTINKHMESVVANYSDDELLDLQRNIYKHFLKHFSLFSSDQMEKEADLFSVMAASTVVENCFMMYLQQEVEMWRAFIEIRFTSLNKYRTRYYQTALLSVRRTLYEHSLIGMRDAYNKVAVVLKKLTKRDSERLEEAVKKTHQHVNSYNDKYKEMIAHYMSEIRSKKQIKDVSEVHSQIYDYCLSVVSVSSKCYDGSPLTDPLIAVSSMDECVSKVLLDLKEKEGIMKRYDSESALSTLKDFEELQSLRLSRSISI